MPERVGGIPPLLARIHLQRILRPVPIALLRRQRLHQPSAPPMMEQPRRNSGPRPAKALQQLCPTARSICSLIE